MQGFLWTVNANGIVYVGKYIRNRFGHFKAPETEFQQSMFLAIYEFQ